MLLGIRTSADIKDQVWVLYVESAQTALTKLSFDDPESIPGTPFINMD